MRETEDNFAMENRMGMINGAEACVLMLKKLGVQHIFGLCGDTSLPLYDALYRLDHGMTHILTRDERSASYMADVYSKVSGRFGVCEGPSGGGATYIFPGIVEANDSSSAVLAVTTDISTTGRGRYTLTEMDQGGLFGPFTKFSGVIDRAEEIPATFVHAFHAMTSERTGAAHIGLPFDVQKMPLSEELVTIQPEESGLYPSTRLQPDMNKIEAAAEAILESERPLIICSAGVFISGAEDALLSFAEFADIPVATSISGQGCIADSHPLALGVVGSNGGTAETRRIVDAADLVIFIGSRAGSVTTMKWNHPEPGSKKVIHIDADASVFGANYPDSINIHGDAKLSLTALRTALAGTSIDRPGLRNGVKQAKLEKFAAFREFAGSNESPILPERTVAELQEVLPEDAVIVSDPGTPCPYLSAFYTQEKPGRRIITNRAHGALGYSLPGVVGAYYGALERGSKCVAVMGDGSFGFAASELETIARLNIPVTMIVFSNDSFGWIKAGQRHQYDERYFSVDFSRLDHAKVAEAYGIKAWTVTDPRDLRPVLSKAIESEEPTLVDIISQPLHEANAPVSAWVS